MGTQSSPSSAAPLQYSDVSRRVLFGLILIFALVLVGFFTSDKSDPGFRSSELAFTETLPSGMKVVPASCPSNPHYAGECSCVPVYVCGGGNLVNSCTGAVIQTCAYGCSSGACLPPPNPNFVSFAATNPGGAFTANGHLQAKPILLASGNSTRLYWNAENVSSCAVTGTNGDSWTGASSGSSGRTSGPIPSKTTYTLVCEPLPGASSGTIIESVDVNIVPVFQEV